MSIVPPLAAKTSLPPVCWSVALPKRFDPFTFIVPDDTVNRPV